MVRIMIILLLAGSGYLGWSAMEQQKTIDRYEAALEPDGQVERLARSILTRAHNYTRDKERSAKEGLKGDGADSVNTYVFEIAARNQVQWGNPKISKPRSAENMQGYEDSIYKITPAEKSAEFDRNRIANFFYLLEAESRKLRISNIDLRLAEKNIKPHDIPNDRWSVDVTVVMRERKKK